MDEEMEINFKRNVGSKVFSSNEYGYHEISTTIELNLAKD
jgi:hypothetical protein